MTQKGFSLIELMIVIAIIGILASIAVPSYQNYIFRSRTSELISTANALANNVNQFIQEQGQVGTGATGSAPKNCANISQVPILATTNVAVNPTPISTTDCSIQVSGNADSSTNGAFASIPKASIPTITLTPLVQTDGSVTWKCSSAKNKYAPSNCQ